MVLQYGGTFGVEFGGAPPYFLFCDNNLLNSGRQPRSWLAQLPAREREAAVRWERTLYNRAAGIFTFSEYIRASFVGDYDLPENRVTVVGSGPNLAIESIPAARPARSEAHAPNILFVGRDFEHKGGPVLIEAFKRVRREIPNVRLTIIGPKSLDAREPGVEFLGYLRKDVPAEYAQIVNAYADADVFCLPTRYESFGIAFLEAMWFGLPVIGPDQWAIPEMVEDGVTGRLVRHEDVSTYAEYLLDLLRDPARARAMGRRGRERAEARFTWAHVTRIMDEVITTYWSDRGGPRR